MLTVIDEFTKRCMAVAVERRLNSDNVLHCLTELFVQHGPPDHIRSDNGSEFTAHTVRDWLGRIGVKTGNVTSYVSGREGCLLPVLCFRGWRRRRGCGPSMCGPGMCPWVGSWAGPRGSVVRWRWWF